MINCCIQDHVYVAIGQVRFVKLNPSYDPGGYPSCYVMTKEALVFDVSDSSYGKYVLLNSHKVPVVVAFESVWSEHCMAVAEIFASLASEFAESFVFARVDVDHNPELKDKYSIENVPTLAVFVDGEPVRFEPGVLQEHEARALLRDYGIYNASDDMRQRARELHVQGDTPQAITLLAEAMRKDPTNTRIALDMVQIFIDMGEYAEAASLLGRLPETDRESETGKSLAGQLWIIEQAGKTEGAEKLSERVANNPEDFDARFDMAICEMSRHDYEHAMEQLFYIQEHAPEYKEGAAREMIVTIINMLAPGNPEFAQQFRRKLSGLLAQ
jgi:putative thioredoxin